MIDDEIGFVKRAVELYGEDFKVHLATKGFADPYFLRRWAAISEILNTHQSGGRALDLGVGPGWSSVFLAARGFDVVACDVSPDMLAFARENAARYNQSIDFREMDISRELPDGPFNVVLIVDALHHCPDEKPLFRKIYDVLLPGGMFLLAEPDWFHAYTPHARAERREFGTTERSEWAPLVRRHLRKAGFVDIRRYHDTYAIAEQGHGRRLKSLVAVTAGLTIGYPKRLMIMRAKRPLA